MATQNAIDTAMNLGQNRYALQRQQRINKGEMVDVEGNGRLEKMTDIWESSIKAGSDSLDSLRRKGDISRDEIDRWAATGYKAARNYYEDREENGKMSW